LGRKRFENDEELRQFTETRLREAAGDVYETGVKNLMPRHLERIGLNTRRNDDMRAYANV